MIDKDSTRIVTGRDFDSVTMDEIRHAWEMVEKCHLAAIDVPLISHETFSVYQNEVQKIEPGAFAKLFQFVPFLFNILYALRLLRSCPTDGTLIVNGSAKLWFAVGILNRIPLIGFRTVLCWDIFVEVNGWFKKMLVRAAMKGVGLAIVWSRAQVQTHAEFLRLPSDQFLFLPYKSNHSRHAPYNIEIGRYVFAGGNGKRDYRCLVDAVRGTGIPVVISATNPKVRATIEPIPNVIVVGAPEPAFAQLQAAAEFVVIPMTYTGLKGGGEANFCNGMWHGKPVIAADNIAASDYIVDGKTGFVVPSGNSQLLRQRIVELWSDPALVKKMGQAARAHADTCFTQERFVHRLLVTAKLLARQRNA